MAVARQLGSPVLLDSVRTTFVTAMDDAARVAAIVAIAAMFVALVVLPRRAAVAIDRPAAPEAPGTATAAAD
jgi:hypothetical protein